MESILSRRDYERYMFDEFIQNGYEIKVLDLTSIYNQDYNEDVEIYTIAKELVFSPSCKKEILEYISGVDQNTLIISLSRVNKNTLYIYNHFFKKGNKFGFIQLGTTPDVYLKFKKKSTRSLLRKLKNAVIKKIYGAHSNFYIVGSKADILKSKNHILYSKQSRLIHYNSLDYNLFVRNEKLDRNTSYKFKYVVFLDEDAPNHPDKNISGIIPVGKNYHSELNLLFSKIETKFSVKVIIAAHPRSHYEKIGNPFEGRQVVKFKTIELVKNSEFVLAHASTSISFAILYKKPILFLYSRNYHHTYIKSIKTNSEILSSTVIDVSSLNYRLPDSFEINNKSYIDFIENYLNFKNPQNLSLVKLIEKYLNVFI